jgi:hypothetical protein
MPAAHHDLVLAITSHLPHLIAYTIVGTADELAEVTRSEVLKFSAGGFRDFTRIAASDPTMWRDVFLANKDAVLEMLGTFNEDLAQLDARDPPRRRRRLVRTFCPHPRHPPRHRRDRPGFAAPDFGRRIPICRSSRCRGPTPLRTIIECSLAGFDRQRFAHRRAQRRERERLLDHVVNQRVEAVGAFALIGVAGHQAGW